MSISFNITVEPGQRYQLVFLYYSLVTISTLAYGDITPKTEIAQSISALEAVVGQLYLVIIVAWLVSAYKPDLNRLEDRILSSYAFLYPS